MGSFATTGGYTAIKEAFARKEPGRDGDEILLHELVHGLSSLVGRLADSMAGPAGYSNLEEFTAIVISNLYASETNRPLRNDHGGFDRALKSGKLAQATLRILCQIPAILCALRRLQEPSRPDQKAPGREWDRVQPIRSLQILMYLNEHFSVYTTKSIGKAAPTRSASERCRKSLAARRQRLA